MGKTADKIKRGAKRIQEKFTTHPNEMGQSYGKHLLLSWKTGLLGFLVSCQYLIHGCFPFVFKPDCECEAEDNPRQPLVFHEDEQLYNDESTSSVELDSGYNDDEIVELN